MKTIAGTGSAAGCRGPRRPGRTLAAAGLGAAALLGTATAFAPAQAASAASLPANASAAWSYFTGQGLTPVQAAGLVGNLMGESSINPDALQVVKVGGKNYTCPAPPATPEAKVTCGVGIAQWTNPSGRLSGLTTLAKAQGMPWDNLSTQLQYVWQELTTSYSGALKQLEACTDTSCATKVVEQQYEKPADEANTTCSTSSQPSYCRRLDDANEVLAAYGGTVAPTAVRLVPVPSGGGYWLLSNQGGVYSYGSAQFYGSAAGQSYFSGRTAVGMAADPSGTGYWIVSADGGVYSYGSAGSYGSASGQSYFSGQTAVGIVGDPAGTGYWIVSAAGGVYAYGSAQSYGSAAGQSYFSGRTAVGMAADPSGTGYWIVSADGGVYSYGSAGSYGSASGQSYFSGRQRSGSSATRPGPATGSCPRPAGCTRTAARSPTAARRASRTSLVALPLRWPRRLTAPATTCCPPTVECTPTATPRRWAPASRRPGTPQPGRRFSVGQAVTSAASSQAVSAQARPGTVDGPGPG